MRERRTIYEETNFGDASAEVQTEAVEIVEDTKTADAETVTVHFKNTNGWSTVKSYYGMGSNNTWGKILSSSWPGDKVNVDSEHPGYYTITATTTSDLYVIFNNGSGGTGNQTEDIYIYSSKFAGPNLPNEFWVDGNGNSSLTTNAPEGWYEDPVYSPVVEGSNVTFNYRGSASSVSVFGDMKGLTNGTNWPEYKMTKGSDGVFTCTLTDVAPGLYNYKLVIDGAWETDPANDRFIEEASGNKNSLCIVPGFYNYGSIDAGRGEATPITPKINYLDASGNQALTSVTYEKLAGNENDGVIIDNKNKTILVPDTYTGSTYQLTATTEAGYSAVITVSVVEPKDVVISPEINGNQVTFRYKDTNSFISSVYVSGTMNGWSTTANQMIYDASTGVYACTMTLNPGRYQYKFVVTYSDNLENPLWMLDPKNVSILTEASGNQNSVVTIAGTGEDTNKITVKVHYTGRTDNNYTDWNLWAWADNIGGKQYNFDVENGEHVATIEIDDARANKSLSFIVRKGDWKDRDWNERYVDLSTIVSGTIHCHVTSGIEVPRIVTDADVVTAAKILDVDYIRKENSIEVLASLPIEAEDLKSVFALTRTTGEALTITDVAHEEVGVEHKYTLSLKEDISDLANVVKGYILTYDGFDYQVTMPNVYATEEFEENYTYTGNDLGAAWTKEKTTFKVWAPTADDVTLNLYETGSAPLTKDEAGSRAVPENITETPYKVVSMKKGDKGVWTVVVEGDLNGKYYTYSISIGGKTSEACDPYARTTGVNGKRAMVLDLDSTDPEGWENDKSPNAGMDQTDAIIYELHVRDLTNDADSGVSEKNRGKYLGVTETDTTNGNGQATGLDHIIDLGVTHIHFLPIYDYGSVDEADLDRPQFNWGYDPVNYNVPEGSYSTDPYNGEVRVKELKQMVQTLHKNNINVVMDVVYNHVYNAGEFAFNQIVPDYFSRTTEDGYYSNSSGCGNDTASERDMVRKYIVESVVYWAEEYHIDGFRFDLVGLIDTETINKIVEEVHKINPSIIFYGEGWDMDGTVMNPRQDLAKQGNAYQTPGFAYFSDTIRDTIKGKNDEGDKGFVNGGEYKETTIEDCMMGINWWSSNPSQIVNYASCHDNYTLKDKINITTFGDTESNRIKMNNLSAVIYMMAEGIPLIHAGEEMLRTKVDSDGTVIHNSYNASDAVNNLDWSDLNSEEYQKVVDYYAGLIEFRKNHETLRLDTAAEVEANVSKSWVQSNVMVFKYKGKTSVSGEISDGVVVILNGSKSSASFNLYDHGVESGEWKVCIDDKTAGIGVLRTVTDGNVNVAPLSALVLVKGATVDTESVYINNGYVPSVEAEIPVTDITLDKTEVALTKGETVTLTATVSPAVATDKTVTWTSSDEKVATVNNGVVTAVATGTATITATAGTVSATCTVTVTTVDVTGITLDKETAELEVGKTLKLTATVAPSNATDKTVTWTTSDEKIATVKDGVVTAVAAGTVTITAKVGDKTATCKVTVKAVAVEPEKPSIVEVAGITLDKTSVALKSGATVTLTATVNPSNATDKTVTWTTSDAKVATVDNTGKVTAVANGTAVITAKVGNKTATCTVTVTTDVTKLKLNKSKANLGVGKTLTLKATITPKNASNQKLTWSSSDKKIATVDKNGKVKGKKAGTATITVKTANGKKATCKVTVVKATLNAKSFALQVGKSTSALKVTSTLASDTIKSVKSSNTKIVTVKKSGKTGVKVTAKKKTGKATVTVTMKSGATATCTVKVQKNKVTTTKLTIDKSKVTLKVGKSVKLTVARNPISAIEKITWKSSDKKIATVDKNGKVTAKKAGKVTITAKTSNGKKVTCKVTVKKK